LVRPIQRYHSHADPIWPDGIFNISKLGEYILRSVGAAVSFFFICRDFSSGQ
jgi:hypothetical protein